IGRRDIVKGPAATQHGLRSELVSGSETRLNVLQVAVEGGTGRAAYAGKPNAAERPEARELALINLAGDRIHRVGEEAPVHSIKAFGHRRRDVPTEAQVKRELLSDLDVVLNPRSGVYPLIKRIGREPGRSGSGVSQ